MPDQFQLVEDSPQEAKKSFKLIPDDAPQSTITKPPAESIKEPFNLAGALMSGGYSALESGANFAKNAWEQLNIPGTAHVIKNLAMATAYGPVGDQARKELAAIPGAMLEEIKKHSVETYEHIKNIKGAVESGKPLAPADEGVKAIASGLGMVPFVGPGLSKAANQTIEGDFSGAGGTLAGIVGPSKLAGKINPGATKPVVANTRSAAEASAVGSLLDEIPASGSVPASPPVRLSVAQRTGSESAASIESALAKSKQVGNKVMQARAETKQGLVDRAQNIADRVFPLSQENVTVGKNIHDLTDRRINAQQAVMKAEYSIAEKGAAGRQVDIRQLDSLRPIYDELGANLSLVQKEYNPGYRALRQVFEKLDDPAMKGKPVEMPAMEFDKTLSALKHLKRDSERGLDVATEQTKNTKASGTLGVVIQAGEQAMESAVGSNAYAKLNKARASAIEMFDTMKLKGELRENPAALVQTLSRSRNLSSKLLEDLATNIDPTIPRQVGRTWLEDNLRPSMTAGELLNPSGAYSKWMNLGPTTQKLIAGADNAKHITDVLLAGKKVAEATHLPKADSTLSYGKVALAGGAGAGGVAAMSTHPIATAMGLGAAGAWMFAKPRILAKILTTDGGAKLLTETAGLIKAKQTVKAALKMGELRFLAQKDEDTQTPQK